MQKDFAGVTDHDLEQMTGIFRLLTDKTRLNILLLLTAGERNVSSLCKELKLPQPTVSHHLGLLRLGDFIGNRRAGKQVFYGLNGKFGTAKSALSIEMENYNVRINRKANAATGAKTASKAE